MVGASTGAFGAVWAQAELRKLSWPPSLAEVACRHAAERFDDRGRLVDGAELADAVADLVAAVRAREESAVPFAA